MENGNDNIARLMKSAVEVRNNAYAPYSNFRVGAALLCDNGSVFTGCNVENSVYPLGICAEQATIAKAVSEGCRKFLAIAITEGPCGGCRQVMAEFGDYDVYILQTDGSSNRKTTVKQLLPGSFTPDDLRRGER